MHLSLAFSDLGAVVGILKVGHKKLFLLVCNPIYWSMTAYYSMKLCIIPIYTEVESSAHINMY